MQHSENAVAAKARAAFGRMLTSSQYDELLRKQSVQEISAYLREHTAYAQALEGVRYRLPPERIGAMLARS